MTASKTLRIVGMLLMIVSGLRQVHAGSGPTRSADRGDGTYGNPVLFADYSDPDVIRVGDVYYMVSSSFNFVPGIPVLRSKDLVNWTIVGHVVPRLPSPIFDTPQYGNGIWAPSIRYHAKQFWVYYGDPDLGIFMSTAKHAEGPWQPLVLVRAGKGWIDPCPFWDDDGKAYLVHAWANSRSGIKSVLTVNRMDQSGTSLLDDDRTVFDGRAHQPTIEGPKFYKRNEFYYIFAPAGGVKPGWQTVLRSRNVFGPYEDRIVLHQGSTSINGPHQGAWVETSSGESWFLHFQDRGPYGRVLHLQPMVWKDDWPVIGNLNDRDGIGEPILIGPKPQCDKPTPVMVPQTTDEFETTALGLQWQWPANPQDRWSSLSARKGSLRLYAMPPNQAEGNLWEVPNLLLQKIPYQEFTATTRLQASGLPVGGTAGLLVLGLDYSYVAVVHATDGVRITRVTCKDADRQTRETEEAHVNIPGEELYLRVAMDTSATCSFSYSLDGERFESIGTRFTAREGKWIGAKVGLFCLGHSSREMNGYVDFDWFRME